MQLNKISLTVLGLCVSAFQAQAFETSAKNAILLDYDTGTYLYAKNHDEKMAPASMSKLMTVYILFDKLKNGELSLDDTFLVSENAWRKGGAASGGSTMFLKIGDKVAVEDLLHGIIIQSGNDACIVAAENISGSEEEFAVLMNETAEKLGLKNSSFANSTGLPHPDQKMSAEDLAILSKLLIKDFPEYYHIFSQKEFVYNGIKQGNRNPLLYSMPYADGLKTGHTDEAGFCLTASASKNGRRLIAVMAGMSSNKERSEEAERLMSYGFREFKNYTLMNKNTQVAFADVWYGQTDQVPLILSEDVNETVYLKHKNKYSSKIVYKTPVKAPVARGDVLGQILITDPEGNVRATDLVAETDVAEAGLFSKFISNLKHMLFGK